MNDVLAVLAAVAVVAYVIVRQLKGEPIRGKRLIVLPAVLLLIGIMDLTSARPHPAAVDIFFLAISALITAGIGAGDLARPAGGGRGSGHGRGARISARAPWRSRQRQEPE